MDRNLGARDTKRAVNGKGILHYQFGRKDPFVGNNVNGSAASLGYIGRDENVMSYSGVTGPVAMATSVKSPMVYYTNNLSNWCDEVNSASIIWHDYESPVSDNGKSIFDPSPLGWKVSPDGVCDGFTMSTTTWLTDDEDLGRWYPYSETSEPFVCYPVCGVRYQESATITGYLTHAQYWYSTPSTMYQSYSFYFLSGYSWVSRSIERSAAMSTRAVQHKE